MPRRTNYLPKLAVIAGLAIAPSALAAPYGALRSIAGAYDIVLLGNLRPGSPFQASEVQDDAVAAGKADPQGVGSVNNLPVGWSLTDRDGQTGGGPAPPTTPLDIFGSATDIANASTSLTAQSGATKVGSSGGVIDIALSKDGLNAVDLSVASGAAITGINITNPNGVTPTGLIINVAGDAPDFNGGSFKLGSLSAGQVLFNFGNAVTLPLSALIVEGALLAPLATVSFNSGHIDGALIVNGAAGAGPVRYVGFNDPLPTYVANGSGGGGIHVGTPEPGSIALFAAGLAAIGLFLRRCRAAGIDSA